MKGKPSLLVFIYNYCFICLWMVGFTLTFIAPIQANNKTDSLKSLLPETQSDTTRVKLLNELAVALEPAASRQAITYAKEALELAGQVEFLFGQAQANQALGKIAEKSNRASQAREYHRQAYGLFQQLDDKLNMSLSLKAIGTNSKILGDLDEAMESFYQSTTIDKALNNQSLLANAYTNIAEVYWRKGNIQYAIDNVQKALLAREVLQDTVGLAESYSSIAILYNEMNDLKKSLEYSLKSLETFKRIGNKGMMARSYGNTGLMYKKMEDYEKSMDQFQKQLNLAEELQDNRLISIASDNLGALFHTLGQNEKALDFRKRSLKLAIDIGDNSTITSNLIGFSNIHLAENNLEVALEYANEAYEKAQFIGEAELLKQGSYVLSRIHAALKNFEQAYYYQLEFKEQSDQLLNEENIRQMAARESKYEFEKEKEIERLEQEKQNAILEGELLQQKSLIRWILGLALMLILLIFFIYRSYRTKQNANVELKAKNDIISRSNLALEVARQRAENLLLNILPQPVAEELKTNGVASVNSFKRVSILFSDFEGFTQIAAKMSSGELIEELNTCFTAFDEIIERNHLEKIKTLGDGYMCAGGVPDPNTANPVDAVLAGLQMEAYIRKRKTKKLAKGINYWGCRIGINTGPVKAGVIGSSKFAYDIWGNAVNIASRMENSGQADKINISENTYQLIKDFFDCTCRGEIEAKNGLILKMYFVHRIKPAFSSDEEGLYPNDHFLKNKEKLFSQIPG